MVAGDGIEPPTRGFSNRILISSNPFKLSHLRRMPSIATELRGSFVSSRLRRFTDDLKVVPVEHGVLNAIIQRAAVLIRTQGSEDHPDARLEQTGGH